MKRTYILIIVIAVMLVGIFAVRYLHTIHREAPTIARVSSDDAIIEQNTKELLAIIDTQNPRAALLELANRMKTNPVVFRYCHGIAHEIGHKGYSKYGNFTKALQYQNSICSDGYLHGVIEQHFSRITNTAKILSEMKTICAETGKEIGRCYHGVGHGVMYYTENDLPKAIAICNSYTTNKRAKGNCLEGVFMENFLSDEVNHPSKYVDSRNPFTPCPSEPNSLKPFCYFYAPIYYLGQNNDNYTKALTWCGTAEKQGILHCVRGVGSHAMKYNINNPKFVESLCGQSPPGQIPWCIDGMVSYYLTFYADINKAKKLCAQMSAPDQLACNASVKRKSLLFID